MNYKHFNKLIYFKFNCKFILLAILIGLTSVFFVKAVDFAFKVFLYLKLILGFWIILYIPCMMVFILFLLKNFFPEAEGSGIPQSLAINSLSNNNLNKIFTLRAIFSKILLIFLGTICGGTLGREGGTVQIGAVFMNQLGKNLNLKRRRMLLIVGAAAGMASAFNTPIGGIMFAYEELIKSNKYQIGLFKTTAIAISGVVAISILGNYSYFGRVERDLLFYNNYIFIISIIVGILSGIISGAFTKLVKLLIIDKNAITQWRDQHFYKNAFFCGIIVALIGIASNGLSFGNGYNESKMALSGELTLPASYAFYKLLGALFTTSSGIPGGYFATTLAIGNGIGGLVHNFLNLGNLQQYYLLGMVGFLAALTRAPATSIIMVIQVSSSQIFTLPLIVTALIATLTANLFGKNIYQYQIKKYI
ncbi:MAG TPA: chloride channel protein [Burkholderiales bacterium]|nr:chloride channel protein [Burkholderiales bacterium]